MPICLGKILTNNNWSYKVDDFHLLHLDLACDRCHIRVVRQHRHHQTAADQTFRYSNNYSYQKTKYILCRVREAKVRAETDS